MTEKPFLKRFLNLRVILFIGLALAIVSFIGGSVGAMFRNSSPLVFLATSSPQPVLPAEKPFAGLFVTNTMIASWISILVLFGLFFFASRKMKLLPGGLQNLVEFFCEVAINFTDDVAGKKWGKLFFPVCFTIFLFVLTNAWLDLIPGFGTIEMNGLPLLRNANSDINVPLMLAAVSFCFVEYQGFKAKGVSYLKKFFNFGLLAYGFRQLFSGRFKNGLKDTFMGIVAVFAGFIEGLSELIRMISFTFRLFGNMLAGTIVVMVMIYLIPWVIPSLFYGLEALLGFVQALIFAGLTLGFLTMAVTSEGEEAS
jgi:F-type H+-transporting ATPase subunit a